MMSSKDWVMFYYKHGINILPAKKGKKYPYLKSYSEYKKKFVDEKQIKTWLMEGRFQNIFALLGQISNNITEIDIDVPDTKLEDIFTDIEVVKHKLWIAESSMGKKKIYCRCKAIGPYDDQVVSGEEYRQPNGKKSKPHVEYGGNNKGTILPPSTHYSGVQYKWLNTDGNDNLPELEPIDSVKLYNSIVEKLRSKYNYVVPENDKKDDTPLKKRKRRPRYCFTESHDNGDKWGKQEGHDFRTAVACELIHCSYTNDEILQFFNTHDEISGGQHDAKITLDHINRIRGKNLLKWNCTKLQQKCISIVKQYCKTCKKNQKKDEALYVTSFELPEDKYLEELIIDGRECFVLYNKKDEAWEIIDDYLYGDTLIKPYPIDTDQRDAVILPDGVEEYGTLEELRKEMLEFALEEYDPVDNGDLFELQIIMFLTSWISSDWQKDMAEKFIPMINPRGPSETGKKRFLTIARYLTYHSVYGLKTNRVPTLFRGIAPLKGTLILDEADIADSSVSNELVEFLNSRCDGVPIPRYSTDSKKTEWWHSFGMTILATREGFTDDGMESRNVVMPTATTDNPDDYNLIPPKKWVEKGKKLQRKLLLFKLRHLDGEMPTQLLIPSVSSFRVRESLLIIQGLKDEDPTLFKNISKLAVKLQERIIKERAASPEGLLLNVIYDKINDDNVSLVKEGVGFIIITEKKSGNNNPEESNEQYRTVMTLRTIGKTLGDAFSSSKLAKMWRGLQQDTMSQKKYEGERFRGAILIKNLERLDKIFPKYVPNYKTPCCIESELKLKQEILEA